MKNNNKSNHKIIFLVLLFCINTFCFSQTKKTIFGFALGEPKDSVNKKLVSENYEQCGVDNSAEIFPISLELYSKPELKYNKIPVEHISFTYCYDKLICISIVTVPWDVSKLESLTNSRKIIKQQYNLVKRDYIEIDEEFYDIYSSPAFYSCNDNQDFVLIIYGKENGNGKIPQCYNFMYKSKVDEAVLLKNSYQNFSDINGYTEMTLEELQELARLRLQEEEEKRKQLDAQKLEEQRIAEEKRKEQEANRIEEEKLRLVEEENRKKEYAKKHRFDKFMGGYSGGFIGGGFYNGDISGGFGAFDISIKLVGPLSLGLDWKIGSIKTTLDRELGWLKSDLDAYLSLGFAIPFTKNFNPIIFGAIAPGGFLYQEKDKSSYKSNKYEPKIEGYVDLKTGVIIPLFASCDLKVVYAREFTKNLGQINYFSFLIGGRFF